MIRKKSFNKTFTGYAYISLGFPGIGHVIIKQDKTGVESIEINKHVIVEGEEEEFITPIFNGTLEELIKKIERR